MHGLAIPRSSTVAVHEHNILTKGETDMRIIMKNSMYLPMAAVLLTAALAGPAVAEELVPFNGTLQVQEFPSPGPPPPTGTLLLDGTGGGNATHLGLFTLTSHFTVNLADLTASGPVHFIAANGDDIFTTAVESAVPTMKAGYFQITELHIITGGTGRFANAQGHFTVVRVENFNTGASSGSFQGIITSPGSAK
jgi:hypothetical protein